MNMARSPRKRDYFIGQRGWLDLLGSIPSLGLLAGDGANWVALFRLARLSRLTRIARLMGGQARKELIEDVLQNRGQYATFITVLAAFIVLVTRASSSSNSRASRRTRTSPPAATPCGGRP